jgi:hypothetical protein
MIDAKGIDAMLKQQKEADSKQVISFCDDFLRSRVLTFAFCARVPCFQASRDSKDSKDDKKHSGGGGGKKADAKSDSKSDAKSDGKEGRMDEVSSVILPHLKVCVCPSLYRSNVSADCSALLADTSTDANFRSTLYLCARRLLESSGHHDQAVHDPAARQPAIPWRGADVFDVSLRSRLLVFGSPVSLILAVCCHGACSSSFVLMPFYPA